MLNETDIDLMDEWREEMLELRQRPVSVIYYDKSYDDFTGEYLGEKEESRTVNAVVTELSSEQRYFADGIEYEQGDIKVDITIGLIEDIADKLTRIKHDGKDYEILGDDKKGISRRNRYEMIGREIA